MLFFPLLKCELYWKICCIACLRVKVAATTFSACHYLGMGFLPCWRSAAINRCGTHLTLLTEVSMNSDSKQCFLSVALWEVSREIWIKKKKIKSKTLAAVLIQVSSELIFITVVCPMVAFWRFWPRLGIVHAFTWACVSCLQVNSVPVTIQFRCRARDVQGE